MTDATALAKALTPPERSRLTELESTIEAGMETFVEVGNALLQIREARLYRETHGTFEEYCGERWGWTDRRARQLMSASETVGNVEKRNHGSGPVPTSERQVRPLTKLDEPEEQKDAWDEAVRSASDVGRGPTGAEVEDVVTKRLLRRSARALPEPEQDDALHVATMDDRHHTIAHKVLDHLATLEADDRQEIYRLARSRDERDRCLAMTRSLGRPPMPDPRIGLYRNATDALRAAERHEEGDRREWVARVRADLSRRMKEIA